MFEKLFLIIFFSPMFELGCAAESLMPYITCYVEHFFLLCGVYLPYLPWASR